VVAGNIPVPINGAGNGGVGEIGEALKFAEDAE